jgi:hypothetical protein
MHSEPTTTAPAHLRPGEYRELLRLAVRLLEAIGTPPARPAREDPDAWRAWEARMAGHCRALGHLRATLEVAAGWGAGQPTDALRAFRAAVAALERDQATPRRPLARATPEVRR